MKDDLFAVLRCRRGNWLAHHIRAIRGVCGEVFEHPYDATMIVIPIQEREVGVSVYSRITKLFPDTEQLFSYCESCRDQLPFTVPE